MNPIELILFFIASCGIGLGLFFSWYLWKKDQIAPFSNQLLSLLLFFLSLRIAKSVFYNFIDLPLWIKNWGLAFTLAVGPLLYFYGRSLLGKPLPKWSILGLHLLPAILYFLGSPWIPNGVSILAWYYLYSIILLQSFSYAGISLYIYPQLKALHKGDLKSRWYLWLCLGIAGMWAIYLGIFLNWIPVYLAGAFSFTFLLASLAYFALKKKRISQGLFEVKYKSSTLSKAVQKELFYKIRTKLEEEQLFLEANLSLQAFAQAINENPKVISQLINSQTGKNFSAFLNDYRVKYAQQLLIQPEYVQEKMFTIALDSGFNSLSSFNLMFKQRTQMTPTQYRKAKSQHLVS